jgi:hypothetical protein
MIVLLTAAWLTAAPTWQTDYAAAKRLSERLHRPLLVVAGRGPDGWRQLVRDGWDGNHSRQVRGQFVGLYLDAATPAGRKLAEAFDLGDGGVAVSDRGGAVMAFHHPGALTAEQFGLALARYADADGPVRATATDVDAPKRGGSPSRSAASCGSRIFCPTCRPKDGP